MSNGWNHLAANAMAANADPVVGGIIDSEIVSGKWFVIPNNNDLLPGDGFETKADAFAFLEKQIAALDNQGPEVDTCFSRR